MSVIQWKADDDYLSAQFTIWRKIQFLNSHLDTDLALPNR